MARIHAQTLTLTPCNDLVRPEELLFCMEASNWAIINYNNNNYNNNKLPRYLSARGLLFISLLVVR